MIHARHWRQKTNRRISRQKNTRPNMASLLAQWAGWERIAKKIGEGNRRARDARQSAYRFGSRRDAQFTFRLRTAELQQFVPVAPTNLGGI